MYQIGQFAKLMDISPRMLRHYECQWPFKNVGFWPINNKVTYT
ncbi:MerR family DNA-binding transcriptional regulator, partial [Enterococcus faecalis]